MDQDKSQLMTSLKKYLNNKSRLQPIIGLGSIIECVNVGSRTIETLYLCEVCVRRLTKVDMWNHIIGSHHRFNYIKSCHPHLVCKWLGNPDLSKMAWPLMEMAKVLEKKEGPGIVQLLELHDALFGMITRHNENHAVTLMKILKHKQAELKSLSETKPLYHPVASQRIVLPAQNPKTFETSDMKLFPISQETESRELLKQMPTPRAESVQVSSVVSENSNGFLDDFSGAKPLVGLARVVEFRSEDGCSYCFLCHCCRIRSTKKDLVEHLTSSSHLVNYLMENYPDQLQALGEVTGDDFQRQSLAAKVEEEEGRGEIKIVNVPESICRRLTGKSYHWCLMEITNRRVSLKSPLVMTKQAKIVRPSTKRKNKKGKPKTMFNVSLPIGKGELLLERRSFNTDHLFESPESNSSKLDINASSPDMVETRPPTDDPAESYLELPASELEQHTNTEDADPGDHLLDKNILVTVFQDKDSCFDANLSGVNNLGESRERSSKDWKHEGFPVHSMGLSPANPHAQPFSPYAFYYRQGNCGSDLLYSSASAGANDAFRFERESSLQEHHQHETLQSSWSDAGARTHSMREHQVAPFLEAARIDVETHSNHIPVRISSDRTGQVNESVQRRAQTYTEYTFDHYQAPPRYTTLSTAFDVSPMQQMLMFCDNQGALPRTNPNFMYPVTDHAGFGRTQADAFIHPGQTVCYTPSSEVYFRACVPH